MLLNAELNDTTQKILCEDAVHTCECVRNSLYNRGSTTCPFGSFYGEKPNIIGLFSEFGSIIYVTNKGKFNKQTMEKHSR